jgi:hypothetical protein
MQHSFLPPNQRWEFKKWNGYFLGSFPPRRQVKTPKGLAKNSIKQQKITANNSRKQGIRANKGRK